MDQECQTCGVEAQSHETQTLKIDCVSHEVQTEHQDARAPKGYYVVCMYGDSHMKTCYRYLLQLLEPDTDINLVHENHPRENILIDRSFSVNFREYHSNYVCHKRKLFIEYVFVRTVFDTYLESHMLKHHLSGSSIDLIFINSALWDIKNRAGRMEYERRVHCFHEHVQMLTKEKRGLLRVVGIIFNAIDPAVIPVGSPFFLCKNSIIENLGSFNNSFAAVFQRYGFPTFCLEHHENIALASDGIHYKLPHYIMLAKTLGNILQQRPI
jgi:hypothetical protein